MGAAGAIIPAVAQIAGTAIPLIAGSGGPNYPSFPKINKLPVQEAKNFMQNYEQNRMDTAINEWKTKFPLLYQGLNTYIGDIGLNQQGKLDPRTLAAISSSGLETPNQSNQYRLSTDLGLAPNVLAQRTSGAVTRQIALNPEWTNKISGGVLATMLANNYENQNAYTMALSDLQATQYRTGQAQQANYNTAALLGLSGAIGAGYQYYQNTHPSYSNYNNPFSVGTYIQGNALSGTYPSSYPGVATAAPPSTQYGNTLWNSYNPYSNYGNDLWSSYAPAQSTWGGGW